MNPYIKPFKELDIYELYQLLKLRFDVFVVEQVCIYDELDDVDQNATHFFFKDGNEITAYLRVYKKDHQVASIGRVVVNQKHRNKGLARKICKHGILFIQNNWKFKRIEIGAQLYLKKFYEDLGFKQTSDTYDDCGIPHITMEMLLPQIK